MRAALRVFAEKDFAEITLRDIQRASGFDAALIYYYFKDKRDLFNAAVKFALSEASGGTRLRISPDGDPAAAIEAWMRHCLEMADANRTIFRIMLHYAGSKRGAGVLDRSIRSFYRREEFEVLARSIERGIAAGIFRPVNPAEVARFVSVHLDGITGASVVRRDFDVKGAFKDLKAALWLQLGYAPGSAAFATPTERPVSRAARPAARSADRGNRIPSEPARARRYPPRNRTGGIA